MIIEDGVLDIEVFKQVFEKKFKNFLAKAPIFVSKAMAGTKVIVTNEISKEKKEFSFDFDYDVKNNIKHIKEWLVKNWYPIMVSKKVEKVLYSAEEIQKMVSENFTDMEDILSLKKSKVVRRFFKIERIITERDELFVYEESEEGEVLGAVQRYKLFVPSAMFIRRLLEDTINSEVAFNYFEKHSKLINTNDQRL